MKIECEIFCAYKVYNISYTCETKMCTEDNIVVEKQKSFNRIKIFFLFTVYIVFIIVNEGTALQSSLYMIFVHEKIVMSSIYNAVCW